MNAVFIFQQSLLHQHKSFSIMDEQEVEIRVFTIHLQNIKMRVKFACRMKLEVNGQMITGEVTMNQSEKFIFNQEVVLNEDVEKSYMEIIAHLNTDKGAKYIAGIVKLDPKQLDHQQGELLCVPVTKCLDSEAICELRVSQITTKKVTTKKIKHGEYTIRPLKDGYTSPIKNSFGNMKFGIPAKSEYQYPDKKQKTNWKSISPKELVGNKSVDNDLKINSMIKSSKIDIPDHDFNPTNRDKLIEAELYKENYQKLKQKYKKQSQLLKHEQSIRMGLQSRQNTYKLQIMKQKLKIDENQKILTEKSTKIKELQIQLSVLQQKQLDIAYLKQEIENKDHSIKMLEETIQALTKDNQSLKNMNKETFQTEQRKNKELRDQLAQQKSTFEQKMMQIQQQLKYSNEAVDEKQINNKALKERIQRQLLIIEESERQQEKKVMEYEQKIRTEREQHLLAIQNLKMEMNSSKRTIQKLTFEIEGKEKELDQCRAQLLKFQNDSKIILNECDGFRLQIIELKKIKEKYNELTRQNKLSIDKINSLDDLLQKVKNNSEDKLSELKVQLEEQVSHFKLRSKEYEQKYKVSQNQLKQTEKSFEQKRIQAEKLMKSLQSLNKQQFSLKQQLNNYELTLVQKSEQIKQLSSQAAEYKSLSKSGGEKYRIEIDNLKADILKSQNDYSQERQKKEEIDRKYQKTNDQLISLKNKYRNLEDEHERTSLTQKQAISSLNQKISASTNKIDQLNSTIESIRQSEKQSLAKNQELEIVILKLKEQIAGLEKELKQNVDTRKSLQNQLQMKIQEIQKFKIMKENSERKIEQLEETNKGIRLNLVGVEGEKSRNDKILEILNKQINENKMEIQGLMGKIAEHEKNEGDLLSQIKKSKEEVLKIELKNSNMKKDQEKMQTLLYNNIYALYAQLAIQQPLETQKQSPIKSLITSFTQQFISKLTQQYTAIKSQLTRLIQQKNSLNKYIQELTSLHKNEISRYQSIQGELHKRISLLETEQTQKQLFFQQNYSKFNQKIEQLQQNIQMKEETIKEYALQYEQLTFTLSSLQMDQSAALDNFTRKESMYLMKIRENQENLAKVQKNLENDDQKIEELEKKISEKNRQYEELFRQFQKLETLNKNLSLIIAENQTVIIEYKSYKKQTSESLSELEFRLSSMIEYQNKLIKEIEEQQAKANQQRQFIKGLMKEKQNLIKADLQKAAKIIEFEGEVTELNGQKQIIEEQLKRSKLLIDENRKNIKARDTKIKELEVEIEQLSIKLRKNLQKTTSLSSSLSTTTENLTVLEKNHQQLQISSQKEIARLSEELNCVRNQLQQSTASYESKVASLQTDIEELQHKIIVFKKESESAQEKMYEINNKFNKESQKTNILEKQIEEHVAIQKNLSEKITELEQEIQEKEENLFDFSGKNYQLEQRIVYINGQHENKLEEVISEWESKFASQETQFIEKIEIIEKEKSEIKEKYEEATSDYKKIYEEIKVLEIDHKNEKKILEERIKRLEEDRLGLASAKNTEIQRISEQSKSNFQLLKSKEANIRKLNHELQNVKIINKKFEKDKKEMEEKTRDVAKSYEQEIWALKQEQTRLRVSQQSSTKIQWQVQRQIKRSIQNCANKAFDGESGETCQKLMKLFRNLQDETLKIMEMKGK